MKPIAKGRGYLKASTPEEILSPVWYSIVYSLSGMLCKCCAIFLAFISTAFGPFFPPQSDLHAIQIRLIKKLSQCHNQSNCLQQQQQQQQLWRVINAITHEFILLAALISAPSLSLSLSLPVCVCAVRPAPGPAPTC